MFREVKEMTYIFAKEAGNNGGLLFKHLSIVLLTINVVSVFCHPRTEARNSVLELPQPQKKV
jgi:hypothetical protein